MSTTTCLRLTNPDNPTKALSTSVACDLDARKHQQANTLTRNTLAQNGERVIPQAIQRSQPSQGQPVALNPRYPPVTQRSESTRSQKETTHSSDARTSTPVISTNQHTQNNAQKMNNKQKTSVGANISHKPIS